MHPNKTKKEKTIFSTRQKRQNNSPTLHGSLRPGAPGLSLGPEDASWRNPLTAGYALLRRLNDSAKHMCGCGGDTGGRDHAGSDYADRATEIQRQVVNSETTVICE